MRSITSASLAVVTILILGPLGARAADGLEAGVGVADITPKLDAKQPIWLAGKENNRAAAGVHDPLYARAIVLRHAGQKIALVSVDSIGLPHTSVVRARAGLHGFDLCTGGQHPFARKSRRVGIWGTVGR